MPGATPVPRGPNRLTLYDAGDLLTATGCPVCRYAAEAGGDRYLAWFAADGHADAVTVTRLCEAGGMCPRHTRGMLGQPGAAERLTALYRYLLPSAVGRVLGGGPLPAACPACGRDGAATGHATDTLLEGLREERFRRRYTELGGLCLPHLGTAVTRSRRRLAGWLVRGALSRLAEGHPAAALLAGEPDPDAAVRARLRAVLPVPGGCGSGMAPGRTPDRQAPARSCPVCLAAATAERDCLAWLAGHRDGAAVARPERPSGLCAAHLQDECAATVAADGPAGSVTRLLGWQAGRSEADLKRLVASLTARSATGLLPGRLTRGRSRGDLSCPACRARTAAGESETERLRRALTARPASGHGRAGPWLCLRHVAALRGADRRAGDLAARSAGWHAKVLGGELDEAFRKQTWAHRHESRGAEMTAWRRAPAFIDGAVYGGGPPVRLP